ncbi:hypothetical protein D8834_00600 [Streptococcus oralis]|nr:hypothetical protein D8834_00600 [Streptococcus oralis]
MKPPTSTGDLTLIVPLATEFRTVPYLPMPLGSELLSTVDARPAARALVAVISASTYVLFAWPFQISPTIPARFHPLSPTPSILPMKATLLTLAPSPSNLLTTPAISFFAIIWPVTLTFSITAFLTILATGAIFSAQGILIFTLPRLIFFTEAFSMRSNNGRAIL